MGKEPPAEPSLSRSPPLGTHFEQWNCVETPISPYQSPRLQLSRPAGLLYIELHRVTVQLVRGFNAGTGTDRGRCSAAKHPVAISLLAFYASRFLYPLPFRPICFCSPPTIPTAIDFNPLNARRSSIAPCVLRYPNFWIL